MTSFLSAEWVKWRVWDVWWRENKKGGQSVTIRIKIALWWNSILKLNYKLNYMLPNLGLNAQWRNPVFFFFTCKFPRSSAWLLLYATQRAKTLRSHCLPTLLIWWYDMIWCSRYNIIMAKSDWKPTEVVCTKCQKGISFKMWKLSTFSESSLCVF